MSKENKPKPIELKEEDIEQVTGGRLYYCHRDINDAIANFTGVCCNKNLTSNGFDYERYQGHDIGFDIYKCDVCGKEYRRYWEGNFWTSHDYYYAN